jgi:hypothetical protein
MPITLPEYNSAKEIAIELQKVLNSDKALFALTEVIPSAKISKKTKQALSKAIIDKKRISFELCENKKPQYKVLIDFLTKEIEVTRIPKVIEFTDFKEEPRDADENKNPIENS